MRLDMSIKRGIDFYQVEALRYEVKRMMLPLLHPGWIETSFPVFVRPARRADADWWRGFHSSKGRCQQVSTATAWVRASRKREPKLCFDSTDPDPRIIQSTHKNVDP